MFLQNYYDKIRQYLNKRLEKQSCPTRTAKLFPAYPFVANMALPEGHIFYFNNLCTTNRCQQPTERKRLEFVNINEDMNLARYHRNDTTLQTYFLNILVKLFQKFSIFLPIYNYFNLLLHTSNECLLKVIIPCNIIYSYIYIVSFLHL